MRSGPAAAAGARALLHACPRSGAPAPVPGRGRSREQDGGAPSRERDKWRESLPEKAGLGEVGGYRAGEIRESHRGLVGGLVGAEGGGAPRGINSRPGFDRRGGDWRCRPPSPRGEGRSARSGRGWGGGLDCPVGGGWRPRGRSRGGGWREGAGSGARAGATIAPRAGLSVAAVASAVGEGGRRGGAGGGLCAGRRAAVLSPPLPVERLGQPGRPRLPPDARPTAAAAAASPRPCREGRRRGGLPGRRGEQVRARGPPRLVRGSAEGAARKPRRPECHRLPPRPRPAPVLLAPGFAEGFPEAVAVTLAGSWGRRLSAPGQRSGSGTWRKGKAGGAPARGERGAPGRAARRGYGPRRGDGPRAAGLAVFTPPRESPLPRSGLN